MTTKKVRARVAYMVGLGPDRAIFLRYWRAKENTYGSVEKVMITITPIQKKVRGK